MAGAPAAEQGTCSMRFSALARSAFVAEDDARRIIAALVGLDLLAMLDESEARFTAKLVKWPAWGTSQFSPEPGPAATLPRSAHRARRIRRRADGWFLDGPLRVTGDNRKTRERTEQRA